MGHDRAQENRNPRSPEQQKGAGQVAPAERTNNDKKNPNRNITKKGGN